MLNKNLCLLLTGSFLICFQAVSVKAQSKNEVAKIRSEVAAINKGVSKYRKKTINVEGISLEGAEASYYYAAKDLKKITAKMYSETYNAAGEFYYRNGKLIFAFVKLNKYDFPLSSTGKAPKVVSVEEQRFYFSDESLIRMLSGKKELKADDDKYQELKKGIIDTASKIKESW